MISRVGIFAGSFDPIHNGHLAFAEAALTHGLDKVYFLVEPRPRRKQGVRALEHRHAMVEAAIKDNPKLGSILLEHPKFTPQATLPILQNRFAETQLVLLFGDDVVAHMVDHLTDWPHLEELAASAKLIIAARLHDQAELAGHLHRLKKFGITFDYDFVEPAMGTISSSKLRLQLKRGIEPDTMPKAVARYARRHGLYSAG